MITSLDLASPKKGTTLSLGAQRENSRTQLVIVEFGTTTSAGATLNFSTNVPRNVTIWTVLPYIEDIRAGRKKAINDEPNPFHRLIWKAVDSTSYRKASYTHRSVGL